MTITVGEAIRYFLDVARRQGYVLDRDVVELMFYSALYIANQIDIVSDQDDAYAPMQIYLTPEELYIPKLTEILSYFDKYGWKSKQYKYNKNLRSKILVGEVSIPILNFVFDYYIKMKPSEVKRRKNKAIKYFQSLKP